jgi:hypothetical protein
MQSGLYCAMARDNEIDNFRPVTLHGELFFANKGLIELCIEESKAKHPNWEYRIVEVMDGK